MEHDLLPFNAMGRRFEDNGLHKRDPIRAGLPLVKVTPAFPLVCLGCHIHLARVSTLMKAAPQSPQMTPHKWGDRQYVLGRLQVYPLSAHSPI